MNDETKQYLSACGKLAKGKPKNYSAEELAIRTKRLKDWQRRKMGKADGGRNPNG